MKKKIEPTDVVSSIFTARRDLLQGVKSVLAGSGFTVEEADLLVFLYGVRELGWDDLELDTANYVAFKQLESRLVPQSLPPVPPHPQAVRRQAAAGGGRRPEAGSGLHFNALRVRITDAGIKSIRPVWERYARMSARLLEGIPPAPAGGPLRGQRGN